MPLLIVAGIPLPLLRMNKGFALDIPGWSVEVLPSGNRADLSTCWNQVLNLAETSSADGAHILAYHKPEKERARYERIIYSHHRLVWLDHSDLRMYGTDEFNESIRKRLDFELEWRERIRPKRESSPLILPETAFDVKGDVEKLWDRGQWVQIGRDDIESVCRLSEQFDTLHKRVDCWVDSDRRRFVYAGERHREHVPLARLWKYTFRVPDGFHFDVDCPDRRGSFFVRDWEGISYKVTGHINIDCHGHIL